MNRIGVHLGRLGLSQSELARRTGMHPSTVSLIVRGRMVPYESQLARIASALAWKGEPTELLEEVDSAEC